MTSSSYSEQDVCAKCGGEYRYRPLRPFPVFTQILFGVSFVLFLLMADQLRAWERGKTWIWIWAAVQCGLGILLFWQRMAAKRLILRCIRCGEALPSAQRR